MRSKLKNNIFFSEIVDVPQSMQTVLYILDFAMALYEEEGVDVWFAYEEANRLIFSKHFYALSGYTVAQWIAAGGDEKKALEVIKDLISDAVKEIHKAEEQKQIMSKVLSK